MSNTDIYLEHRYVVLWLCGTKFWFMILYDYSTTNIEWLQVQRRVRYVRMDLKTQDFCLVFTRFVLSVLNDTAETNCQETMCHVLSVDKSSIFLKTGLLVWQWEHTIKNLCLHHCVRCVHLNGVVDQRPSTASTVVRNCVQSVVYHICEWVLGLTI